MEATVLRIGVTAPTMRSLGCVNTRVILRPMNLKVRRVDAHPVAAYVMQMLVGSERPEAFLPDVAVSQ